jgi:hypothetical protein
MQKHTLPSAILALTILMLPVLPLAAREETLTPDAVTKLAPDHRNGDKDFKGHGPKVLVRATLDLRNQSKELWVTVYFHLKETEKDWTEAEKTFSRKLYTAPEGQTIERILSDASSEAEYTDTNHQLDKPAVRGGKLVKEFEVMGDTGGNDVGNHTDDDSYVNVYFNEVRLALK